MGCSGSSWLYECVKGFIRQAVKGAGIWSVDTAAQTELLCKSVTIFRSCAWLLGFTKQDIVSARSSHGVPLSGNNFLSLCAGKMMWAFVQGRVL